MRGQAHHSTNLDIQACLFGEKMTELLQETPLTLAEAAKSLPGNPNIATLWRWRRRGIEGVRLETYRIGQKRFTTKEAIARFVERTTKAADGDLARKLNFGKGEK
jgi:hypothetical protein